MLQPTEIISSTTWDQFWIRQQTNLTFVIQRHFQFSVTAGFPHEHQTLPPNNNDRSTKGNQVLDFRILLISSTNQGRRHNRAHLSWGRKWLPVQRDILAFWNRRNGAAITQLNCCLLNHFSNEEVIVPSEYCHRITEKYYRWSSGMKNNAPSPKETKDQKHENNSLGTENEGCKHNL